MDNVRSIFEYVALLQRQHEERVNGQRLDHGKMVEDAVQAFHEGRYLDAMTRYGRIFCPDLVAKWWQQRLIGVEGLREVLPAAWTSAEFPVAPCHAVSG